MPGWPAGAEESKQLVTELAPVCGGQLEGKECDTMKMEPRSVAGIKPGRDISGDGHMSQCYTVHSRVGVLAQQVDI